MMREIIFRLWERSSFFSLFIFEGVSKTSATTLYIFIDLAGNCVGKSWRRHHARRKEEKKDTRFFSSLLILLLDKERDNSLGDYIITSRYPAVVIMSRKRPFF